MKTSILAAVAAVSCAVSVAFTAAAAVPGEKGIPDGFAAGAFKADFPRRGRRHGPVVPAEKPAGASGDPALPIRMSLSGRSTVIQRLRQKAA